MSGTLFLNVPTSVRKISLQKGCSTGRHFTAATQALNTSCSKLNIVRKGEVLMKQILHWEKLSVL